MKRWKRHFEGLLGSKGEEARRESANTNKCGSETGRSEEQECISIEEVREAIKKLKNARAPGICGIHAEMLKARGEVVARWLHKEMMAAWAKRHPGTGGRSCID